MPNWKRSFYAIFAAEILALIGFNASIPIIPFFIQDLGVKDAAALNIWVGACATATAISMFIFAPFWGQLADSYGKRPMLLRAMIGGAVVIALMGAVNRPWQLLVLRGLQGALSGTVAAAVVLVATISPKERLGYTLGMLQTGIYIGVSVGPAFGGLLSDLFGYRVTFLATAVFLLAAAGIVMRFVREESIRSGPAGSFVKSVIPDFSPLAHSPGLDCAGACFRGAADRNQHCGTYPAPFHPVHFPPGNESRHHDRANPRWERHCSCAFLCGSRESELQDRLREAPGVLPIRSRAGVSAPGIRSQPSPAPCSSRDRRRDDRWLGALHQRHDRHARRQKPTRNDLRVEHEHELGWCRRGTHDRSHIIRGLRLRLGLLCRDGGPSSFSHRGTHCQETRAARGRDGIPRRCLIQDSRANLY